MANYCLSPTHPRGRHKARLFAAALGFDLAHVAALRDALLAAARDGDATATTGDEFWQRYEIVAACAGPTGVANVLSVWIIRDGQLIPQLVTAYPVR